LCKGGFYDNIDVSEEQAKIFNTNYISQIIKSRIKSKKHSCLNFSKVIMEKILHEVARLAG
jgi:hypothetical protein